MNGDEIIPELGIVLAAGGSSTRFSAGQKGRSKLLTSISEVKGDRESVKYADMPLFMCSVLSFIDLCEDRNFVIVVKKDDFAKFADILAEYLPTRKPQLVIGGATRMHSVFNGLQALPESAKFAAVHDAARPFLSKKTFLDCIEAAKVHNGAVIAKRMTDTVKLVDSEGRVVKTVDRENLCRVETPQIFPKIDLIKAYKRAFADKISATDDSGVMEHAGYRPFLFEHTGNNRKITYPPDITV